MQKRRFHEKAVLPALHGTGQGWGPEGLGRASQP